MTLGRSLHLPESVLPLVKIKILAWVSKTSLKSLDKKGIQVVIIMIIIIIFIK